MEHMWFLRVEPFGIAEPKQITGDLKNCNSWTQQSKS